MIEYRSVVIGGEARCRQRAVSHTRGKQDHPNGATRQCRDDPSNLAQNASRIADRQTIGRDISGHNATCADSAVASNANAGKDDRVSTNPYVIFYQHRRGRRRHVTMSEAMLVPVNDPQVMTKQTVAPNLDLLVGSDRCAVVDERVIAYGDVRSLMRDDFDRDNLPDQANAIPKFYIAASGEKNAPEEAHRQRQPGLASDANLSVEERKSQSRVA